MIIDARELEDGGLIEADVCVVGSGPAGISLARELARSGSSVAILESGGPSPEDASQALDEGRESGDLIGTEADYLTGCRVRAFGGTSHAWNGWCIPLYPGDFEARSWVDDPGWPIEFAELEPYYPRAAADLLVEPHTRSPERLDSLRSERLFEDGADFETSLVHVATPPTNFAESYGEELGASREIRVVLHATVTEIVVDSQGRRVESLVVAGPEGRRLGARGRFYVLAAGGLEIPRILLASNRVQKEGLGNGHDLVGRYYMDHPAVRAGFVALPYDKAQFTSYRESIPTGEGNERMRAVLHPTREAQERHRVLSSLTVLLGVQRRRRPRLAEEMIRIASDFAGYAESGLEPSEGGFAGEILLASEQLPHPESRVTLTDERDALGMPRIRLDWRLDAQDEASVRSTMELLGRELGRRLSGRVQIAIDESAPWQRAIWSSHPMGTTRMDPDPARGVVDTDGKVHGIDGLYVASSSVFPTAACSNTTLTIVALALRLAEHLRGRLERG